MELIKLNHLEGTQIKHIYLFKGQQDISDDDDLGPDGKKIFTPEEWETVQRESIPVTLIDAYLHSDDTIDTIKKKIIKYLTIEISTKEIYLFGLQQKILNPSIIYNQLTQIDTLNLTQDRLCQYLLNIVSDGCSQLKTDTKCDPFLADKKDIYDFDDFTSMESIDWDAPITLTIPIGQKMVIKKNYPFTANPYNCVVMDETIKKQANNIITTQNASLLFESGEICNNNIFLCLAEEVLTHAQSQDSLTETNFISVYFPNLISKDKIHNLEELESNRLALYTQEKKKMGKTFEKYNERVDLFYNMYYSQKNALDYTHNTPGITQIECTIHPKYTIKFPLEILFKLIHSDIHIPMIKYNPGINRENIYRLFTNEVVATNGKKIPYLYTANNNKKGKIIQLSRHIARKKRVAFYIELEYEEQSYEVYCSFEANGNIHVKMEHHRPLSLATIEEIIKLAINDPILQKIKSYLEQSGYTYILFNNFSEDNIEIKRITYISSLTIKKNIHLKQYLGCLSSIFNVIEGDLTAKKERIIMKYKRVSNYYEMDSIESFINEMQQLDKKPLEIISELQTNFQLSEEQAQAQFANWLSLIRTERDLFENKSFTIRTNTGFPIYIRRNRSNLNTTITVESINDTHYIRFLHIYIDSMLRMIINRNSTAIPSRSITTLCKGRKTEEVEAPEDLQAEVEKGFIETKKATVQATAITFSHDDGADDFLDMFAIEEDDDGFSPTGDEIDEEEIEFGEVISLGDTSLSPQSSSLKSPEILSVVETAEEVRTSASPSASPSASIARMIEEKESGVDDTSPKSDVTSEAEIDLKGMLLKGNNNIFITKKIELQPKLFLKKQKGRFKAYSKACPSQYAKQPMILSEREKAYIDQQDTEFGTKSYDEFLTYGTGDTKYHYICPRFWCLYDKHGKQRSLTLEEINEGACGGWDALIPPGSNKVPDGKRIYELTDVRFHKEGVNTNNPLVYKPMWPGFMDPSKHPDNLCIPCCFTRPTHPPAPWKAIPDGKKTSYVNTETKVTQKKLPAVALENMYKPEGDGGEEEGGPGPSFTRDAEGNILLDSIEGVKQMRESSAKKRGDMYNECNESADERSVHVKKAQQTLKTDAPLLEAWPLKKDQLGYLPMAVQKFLGYNSRLLCQQSKTDRHLKQNQPCLLHKGMEKSENQSFLACIADIYDTAIASQASPDSQPLKKSSLKTIADIKAIIRDHLTIDNFITFQNGNLVKLFNVTTESAPSIDAYKDSILFKQLEENADAEETTAYFTQVVTAFESFKEYLEDDTIIINYEYLWDIICMPQTANGGGGLFPHGLNLIILHSPNDDITNKIELICPTNHYSSQNFDVNRKIVILYSRNGYFEPIYRYTYLGKRKFDVQKLFYLPTISKIMPEIKRVLTKIVEDLKEKCVPLPSMPTAYNKEKGFQSNIEFYKIKHELDKRTLPFIFSKQMVNFETKVIGCLAVNPSNKADFIYIPCLPSAIDIALDFAFIGDPAIWISYADTIQKLETIYTQSRQIIPCKPVIKIVSDNVLVGILTLTNQFVPCIPEPFQASPGEEEADHIQVLYMNSDDKTLNILVNDQKQLLDTNKDEERLKKIKQIHLESHFYNVFRNLLRILLTYYENKTQKNELLANIQSVVINYPQKLKNIQGQITALMNKYVHFVEYQVETLQDIENIHLCLKLSPKICGETSYCIFSGEEDGGVCKIQIPKTNLISGGDNEVQYFGRLADELIRYARIRTFIFQPQKFLSFQEIGYQLREDEIILLEDLLFGNYFEGLVPIKYNPYIATKHIFDNAEPNKTVPYVTQYNWGEELQSEKLNPCIMDKAKQKLKLGYWEEHGLDGYEITEFRSNSFNCSWELVKEIIHIEKMGAPEVTIAQIQAHLIQQYQDLLNDGSGPQLLKVMKSDGKIDQAGSIAKGNSLQDIITPENYYLTTMDFCILAHVYQLPLILLCRTNIRGIQSKTLSFIQGESEHCYIILMAALAPTANSNKSPVYGLISKDGSIQLSVNLLDDTYQTMTALSTPGIIDLITKVQEIAKKKPKIKKGKVRVGHKKKSAKKKGKKKSEKKKKSRTSVAPKKSVKIKKQKTKITIQ